MIFRDLQRIQRIIFISLLRKKVVVFIHRQQDVLIIHSIDMNNIKSTMGRKILLMTE